MSYKQIVRCAWANNGDKLMLYYHDHEWGVPVHEDRGLFEFLVLEGAQAGLTWDTILKRRENYRKAFKNFDPRRVAVMTTKEQARLLHDSGIVRNRLKIESVVNNAKRFLEVQKEFGSFDAYVWQFAPKKIVRGVLTAKDIPTSTEDSERMSKDLMSRGFTFVGPTICYAFMQAVGMVDDHTSNCIKKK